MHISQFSEDSYVVLNTKKELKLTQKQKRVPTYLVVYPQALDSCKLSYQRIRFYQSAIYRTRMKHKWAVIASILTSIKHAKGSCKDQNSQVERWLVLFWSCTCYLQTEQNQAEIMVKCVPWIRELGIQAATDTCI